MAHPPRTVRGVPIDIAARTPVEPLKEGFERGGSPDTPFDELDVVPGTGTGTGTGTGKRRVRASDLASFSDEQRRALTDAIVRYHHYVERGVREEEDVAPPRGMVRKRVGARPARPRRSDDSRSIRRHRVGIAGGYA